jgi:hypothetical protein
MEELLEKSQLKHLVIALTYELYHKRKFGPNLSIPFDELILFGDKIFYTEKGQFTYIDHEFGADWYKKSTLVEILEKKDEIREFTKSALEYKSEEIRKVLNKLFEDDDGMQTMYVGKIHLDFDRDGEPIPTFYCSLIPSNNLDNSFIIKYLESKV